MNDKTRNAFASYGLEILKQSVLLVLYEQRVHGKPGQQYLRVKQVREQLEIRQVPGSGDLVRSILEHLMDDKHVKYTLTDRWQITPEGVSVIEG